MQVGQRRFGGFTLKFKLETPHVDAVRAPAITAAEGVNTFGGPLIKQGFCNGAGSRQCKANGLLPEQHSALTRNQGCVQVGLGKRGAAHHVAQELHVGVEPDNMGLAQRFVQPGQRFFTRFAVHDELGHHRIVKR